MAAGKMAGEQGGQTFRQRPWSTRPGCGSARPAATLGKSGYLNFSAAAEAMAPNPVERPAAAARRATAAAKARLICDLEPRQMAEPDQRMLAVKYALSAWQLTIPKGPSWLNCATFWACRHRSGPIARHIRATATRLVGLRPSVALVKENPSRTGLRPRPGRGRVHDD